MAKVFFNKKLFSNKFIVDGGVAPFEQLSDNQGVIALDTENPDHKKLIDALENAAAKHIGGILKVSEDQYNDLKKNLPFSQASEKELKRQQLITAVPPPPAPKRPLAPAANPAAQGSENGKTIIAWNEYPRDEKGLRLDGPTLAEWKSHGYKEEGYPPEGFATRETPFNPVEYAKIKQQQAQQGDKSETPSTPTPFRPATQPLPDESAPKTESQSDKRPAFDLGSGDEEAPTT